MPDHRIFSEKFVAEVAKELKIADLQTSTIGEVLLLSSELERRTGIPFIRMDQGSPGLPACEVGLQAEKDALDSGVASQYPPAAGIDVLRKEVSRFVKAFIDIDVPPRCCVATTGSVAGSFGSFIAVTQCNPEKNKVLFIDPGFPIQRSQLNILGIDYLQVDIYGFRGEALRDKLESFLMRGDIAAIIYSNPNNPAWICLEESELKIIGELATKHDVIVLEDLAYFGMDFRHYLGKPWEPPYVPTVGRYTDNYILMLSSSKIFSYAGQRMAVACVSERLYDRSFPGFVTRYGGTGLFGVTFTASIMYMITSGVTHTTQYGYTEMLRAATDG
ncbi:MAG: pyridoxal phosphate-dependent aminotransferase, partial [Bacteroidales bacterium]